MQALTDIILQYRSEDGTVFEQPLADIQEAGTLIDPDSGNDLELTGWKFANGQDYIIVEGGLVQNDPALPVFDLDVLDSDVNDAGTLSEITNLHERLLEHPSASLEWPSAVSRAADYISAYGHPEDVEEVRKRERNG